MIGQFATAVLVDSYVIVRSSWHLQGVSELKRGGLEIPGTGAAKIKNGVFIIVRLLLSSVLAMLTALFLSILLFEKDITANLDQHFQKLNAPLLARVTAQIDEPIAKLLAEHQEIRLRLAARVIERLVACEPLPMHKLINETRRCRWFASNQLAVA